MNNVTHEGLNVNCGNNLAPSNRNLISHLATMIDI